MKMNKVIVLGVMTALSLSTIAFAANYAVEEAQASQKSTPPTVCDAWDLKKDFMKVDQQLQAVREILENEEYFQIQSEEVSKWSCGKQAGHLALSLAAFTKNMEENLANPEQNVEVKRSEMAEKMLTSAMIPRGVAQAPEDMRPDNKTRAELLQTFNQAAAKWKHLSGMQDAIANCQAKTSHPVFGGYSSADWVRMTAVHNAHHLKIVRDILRASDHEGGEFGKEILKDKAVEASSKKN